MEEIKAALDGAKTSDQAREYLESLRADKKPLLAAARHCGINVARPYSTKGQLIDMLVSRVRDRLYFSAPRPAYDELG